MKKVPFFILALFVGFLTIVNQPQFGAFAQTPADRVARDRELAGRIRQLTNRSTDGLKQSRVSGSGVAVDLEDRFQNVMLSRIEGNGDPVAACVTSIDEANAFFGRNLETGEIIFSDVFQRDEQTVVAARHGMSRDEFEFYTRLIEDAAVRRAQSPNSATINIVNGDGAGEGFNDPTVVSPEGGNAGTTRGDQRLNLFNFAASIWGAYLDTNVPVNINSQFNSLTPCTTSGGVLGSAGTASVLRDFDNAQFPGTWYHVALANKRAGVDLNSGVEINARFNTDVDNGCLGTGSRFYYGLDNVTPSQRINLLIVLLHEMGHGLGFSSFSNGSTGALFNNLPDIYTRFMFDRTVGKFWYEMTDAERQASALNSNNVFWDGANVKTASGFLTNGRETSTGRVALYTPTTFQSGSSVSHFSTAASPNLLMEPNISVGLPINLDLTRQVMRDIGWYPDSTADVIPDTITNVRPSGGTLVIGSAINITWTNTGGFNRNVTIDLSTDGGITYTPIVSDIANTGSFSFTVPNTITSQGRIRVREVNFVDPAGISAANFAISTTAAPTIRPRFDFDGDGKADVSVFRPNNGSWYVQQSQNGFLGVAFGQSGDKLVPADYDGDGKTDVAVVRNGVWYLLRSQAGFTGIQFGLADDVAVPADYDGDGKADLAVFRPSNGYWYILQSSNNQFVATLFGIASDKPVPADYDGDGKADIAVNRNGNWYLNRSTQGFIGIQFGDANDKSVPADYDGDGKADIAVFRPSTGAWYLLQSTAGFTGITFGLGTDIPTPADYDGDGKTDLAVVRNGNWYLNRTTQGFIGILFGNPTDAPLPNSFVR